jgi:hypothetical protein
MDQMNQMDQEDETKKITDEKAGRECTGISVIWKDGRMQCGGCIVKSNENGEGAEQRSTGSSTYSDIQRQRQSVQYDIENMEGMNQGDTEPDQEKREYHEWLQQTRQEARLRWNREISYQAHWINQQRHDAWLNKGEEPVEQEEKPKGYSQEDLQSKSRESSEREYKETGRATEKMMRDDRELEKDDGETGCRDTRPYIIPQRRKDGEVREIGARSQSQEEQGTELTRLSEHSQEHQRPQKGDRGTPGSSQDRIYPPPVLRSTSSQRRELLASLEQFLHNSEINHVRDLEVSRDPWDEFRHQDLGSQGPPTEDQGYAGPVLVWVKRHEGTSGALGDPTTERNSREKNTEVLEQTSGGGENIRERDSQPRLTGQTDYDRLANALDGETTSERNSRGISRGHDKQTSGKRENTREKDGQPIFTGQLDYNRRGYTKQTSGKGESIREDYNQPSSMGQVDYARLTEALDVTTVGNGLLQGSLGSTQGKETGTPWVQIWGPREGTPYGKISTIGMAARQRELVEMARRPEKGNHQSSVGGLEKGNYQSSPEREPPEGSSASRFSWAAALHLAGPSSCTRCQELRQRNQQLYDRYLQMCKGLEEGSDYQGPTEEPIEQEQDCREYVISEGPQCEGCFNLKGLFRQLYYLYLTVASSYFGAYVTRVVPFLEHQKQKLMQKLQEIQGNWWSQENEDEENRMDPFSQGLREAGLAQMFFCSCICCACRICECGELCSCAGEELIREHRGEIGRFIGCNCQQACEACQGCHCRVWCQCSNKAMKEEKQETSNRQAKPVKDCKDWCQYCSEEQKGEQRVTDEKEPWQPSMGRGRSEYMELRGEPSWGSMWQPSYIQIAELGKQEEVKRAQKQRVNVDQVVMFHQAEEKELRLNNLAKEQLKDYEEDMTSMEANGLFDKSTREMMEQLFFKDEKMREMSLESNGPILATKLASEGYYQTRARGGGRIRCFCCQNTLQIDLCNITAPKGALHQRHNQTHKQRKCRFAKRQSHLDSTPYQWVLELIAIRNRKWTINRDSFLHMSQHEDNRRANREIQESQ